MFDSLALRNAVSIKAIRSHLSSLQSIADSLSDEGYRAAGYAGSNLTLQYIHEQLVQFCDYYDVSVQSFPAIYPYYEDNYTFYMEENITSFNLFAETRHGNNQDIVIAGAHYDAVEFGPGINDNGSGVATILEIAIQMAKLGIVPQNKVRFAFWGTEEIGLQGSWHYVENLDPEELENIAIYVNFDMIGSPNFVRMVIHDDFNVPPLGDTYNDAEQAFFGYFQDENLTVIPIDASLSSTDYLPFLFNYVPISGLFTGAAGIKTEAEADSFGGIVGDPYDPCYHQECDTIENINWEVLDQMSGAAAHVILLLAMNTSSSSSSITSYQTFSPSSSTGNGTMVPSASPSDTPVRFTDNVPSESGTCSDGVFVCLVLLLICSLWVR
jgi:hypothetical protein